MIADRIRSDELKAHYAPVFGAVSRALGIDELEAQRMFLFVTVRGVASAAIRLGLLGSYEAQRLQNELAPNIDGVIRQATARDPDDIAQSAPLIDLFQSTHDRLYSRLFQS